MSGPVRRILFVELLGGLGDVVEAMPAIGALARSHPRAEVEVLTFAPGADLLRHDPHVDTVRVAPKGRAREAVAEALADGPRDLVVSTTDYEGISTLIEASLAPGARAVTDLWRDPPPDRRAGERFVALLIADGVVRPEATGRARLFLTPDERARAAEVLPQGEGPAAALILDAGMAIKRWPEARFAALGRALGARLALRPLVVGDAAARVAEAIGSGARALEPMPLRDLGAVLARCAVAVGGDTGPLRLAALAETRCVALFGPSPSGRYALGPGHAALQGRPDCPERRPDVTAQPCWYAATCPLPRGPESCTHEIAVDEVEAAVAAFLAERAGGADVGARRAPGGSSPAPLGAAAGGVADRVFRRPDGAGPPAPEAAAGGAADVSTPRRDGGGHAPPRAVTARLRRRASAEGVARTGDEGDAPGSEEGRLPNHAGTYALDRQRRVPARPGGAEEGRAERWALDWADAKRILVLRLDNIGDVLMTGPALAAIRRSRPGARIGLLASPSGAQAAPLLPWIDEALSARVLWQEVAGPEAIPFAAPPGGDRDRRVSGAQDAGAPNDPSLALARGAPTPRAADAAVRSPGAPRVEEAGSDPASDPGPVAPLPSGLAPSRAPDPLLAGPFDPAAGEALVRRLAAGRWDGAVVLTSFSQSPHPAALACRRAGIARVAGASDEAGRALTHRLPKGDRTQHQAERNLVLMRALGFDQDGDAMRLRVPDAARAAMRAAAGPPGPSGILLLSPWASAASRQYAPARMAEAARRIVAAHGLRVVVSGAPADAARGAALAAAIPGARDLSGRTSVAEAAALVERARLVLCCNSSAMHMAEALGTPAAILFAGTELPSQWAPRRSPHRLLARPVPCAPCHAFVCPLGHHACLDVGPEEVAAAADALLARAARAAS